jgi:hypothetical protein
MLLGIKFVSYISTSLLHNIFLSDRYLAVYDREARKSARKLSVIFVQLQINLKCSPETSVDFQRTTRRYIPEDSTPHNLSPLQVFTEK